MSCKANESWHLALWPVVSGLWSLERGHVPEAKRAETMRRLEVQGPGSGGSPGIFGRLLLWEVVSDGWAAWRCVKKR